MAIKTKKFKFQMRMFNSDYKLLQYLAAGEGLSMSAYLATLIRKEAKKQGIPE